MSDSSARRAWKLGRALIVTLLLGTAAAHADIIVFERSGLLGATQTVVAPITVSGAGTLRVTLTDLAWPTRFSTLSFALSDASTVLGRVGAPGTQSFTVGGAANLYAHIYGATNSPLDLGLYSLRVSFMPVPLPSAAVLLLAGIGLFAAVRNPGLRALAPRAA